MTAEHIPRILDGKIPSASLLHEIAEDGIAISEMLKYDMTRFTTLFSYTSEMDATIRVISLICEVAQDLTNESSCSHHYEVIQPLQISSFMLKVQGHLFS